MPKSVANFPVDAVLTSIAVAYRNENFIADDVLPIVPTGNQNFKYRKYDAAESFTIPKTTVGRTSAPNQVQFGFTEEDSSTVDYGLDEPVPNSDIENAPAEYNPLAAATKRVTDLILLDREKRTAELVFNKNSYADNKRVTLAGTEQYSHANSDPLKSILSYLDACVMRPNIMVVGQPAWTGLRTHPKIVKATNRNSGDSGVAAREAVAELLEIDKIIVGSGWYNSSKKGQDASLVRLWGKHIALIFQDTLADINGRATFGFTAQWGGRQVKQIPDEDIGLNGGIRVRAGECVRELVIAPDFGYFIENAVA